MIWTRRRGGNGEISNFGAADEAPKSKRVADVDAFGPL